MEFVHICLGRSPADPESAMACRGPGHSPLRDVDDSFGVDSGPGVAVPCAGGIALSRHRGIRARVVL